MLLGHEEDVEIRAERTPHIGHQKIQRVERARIEAPPGLLVPAVTASVRAFKDDIAQPVTRVMHRRGEGRRSVKDCSRRLLALAPPRDGP